MKEYSNKISLIKNARGVYCLDTSIGCNSGMTNEPGGCYNDCYAAKSAKLYNYDFSKTIQRNFIDENHRRFIFRQINKIKLDFVRIGCSGDPSENWEHTTNILKQIDKCNKQIVIITRHWTRLTDQQLEYFKTINICVNTSISALDKPHILENCLTEYLRLKPYCKSILRVVSADFNLNNLRGKEFSGIQDRLFKNEDTLDTILRINKNNELVKQEIINIKKTNFLGKKTLASKFKKSVYMGHCSTCHEMCGVNIIVKNKVYPDKVGISKQLLIPFKKIKLYKNELFKR